MGAHGISELKKALTDVGLGDFARNPQMLIGSKFIFESNGLIAQGETTVDPEKDPIVVGEITGVLWRLRGLTLATSLNYDGGVTLEPKDGGWELYIPHKPFGFRLRGTLQVY